MGNRCADHVTFLYPQKLALTSPTGGGRSVGIVRSRTKATELVIQWNFGSHILLHIVRRYARQLLGTINKPCDFVMHKLQIETFD